MKMSRHHEGSREVKYVYDLPYTARKTLCTILDSNNDWERLGGEFMKFKWCDIEEFRRAERCGDSPTNRLLQAWGQKNHTVSELFYFLWQMDHYQAMRSIKSCVPEKYHKLLTSANQYTTEMLLAKKPATGIVVGSNSHEPLRAVRPASGNSHSTVLETSSGSAQNTSVLVSTSRTNHNDSVLAASVRPIQNSSNRQALPVQASGQQPASLRVNAGGTMEGACALVSSHNFNQATNHANSYPASPKVPATFLHPTTTTQATTNTRVPLAEVKQHRVVPDSPGKPFKKIINNEEYGMCAPVSCEDNNSEESSTKHKVPPYDPGKSYLARVEEKLAKEAARAKVATKSNNNSVTDPVTTAHPHQSPQKPPSELTSAERHRRISNASDSSNHSTSVPVIPYKELEEATALWSQDHLLGRGGFGTVFKGTWKNTEVAIKKIEPHDNASFDNARLHISQSLEELKLLQSYRHDNILQVYGYSTDHEMSPCLVYQFMPNGSLEDRLQCRKIEAFGEGPPLGATTPLTWLQRFRIATGTARALQFLHTVKEKPLIHGDVKSANILLDQNYEPKLGDFGLAREGKSQSASMKVSRVHGTKPYLPDDYLRSKKLSVKVDTYSYGIVLFELCTGLRAYDEKRREAKFLKDLVENITRDESLRDKNVGVSHDGQVFNFLFQLGKNCVKNLSVKRPDMTTVFKELESYGLVLEETARARRISMGETSSISSSPRMLQVCYDTAGSVQSPSPSTQPSLPHFFHPSPSPSAASMLPIYHSPPSPSSVPPRSPGPSVLPPNSPAPPLYTSRPVVHANIPRFVANGSVAYHPRMLHFGGANGWKQGAGGNIVYGMGPQPNGPQFHLPHINVSPAVVNCVEGGDPPSYSETISQGPAGAVGGVGSAPPMLPQLSGLCINDSHTNRISNDSEISDSDYGYSESSLMANTTKNIGPVNGSHSLHQGAAAATGLPTVIPTVIPQQQDNFVTPLLTELGTKSGPDLSSKSLSCHSSQPTAAKKKCPLFA